MVKTKLEKMERVIVWTLDGRKLYTHFICNCNDTLATGPFFCLDQIEFENIFLWA